MQLSEIVALIRKNCDSQNEELAAHAKTLLGPRTRGSLTEKGLEDLDHDYKFARREHPAVRPGVEAYFGFIPELRGLLGAVELRRVCADHTICIRDGKHGPELFIDRPQEDKEFLPTSAVTVLIGEHEGERAVLTWHPGDPLCPFDGKTFTMATAVKLHNGE